MKEKKKGGKFKQALPILCFLLLGAACGIVFDLYLFRTEPDGKTLFLMAAIFLIGLYLGMAVQIVLHEAGHLLFGLMTGYRFSSFRVGSLMLIKKDGKLRLARYSLAGTGGQCLMAPPEWTENGVPTVLYNLGGSIVNLLTVLICLPLLYILRDHAMVSLLLAEFALIGFGFCLMNGVPMNAGGVANDGANALSLRKDPEALRAFYLQMRISHCTAEGQRLKDMPAEWFTLPEGAPMDNALVASIAVFECNRLMDAGELEAAQEKMRALLEAKTGIIGLHRHILANELAFCEVMGEDRPEEVERLLTKEVKKTLKTMKTNPSVLRTEYALALSADDQVRAQKLLQRFEAVGKSYPYPHEIEGERELMKKAEEKFGI